MDDAAALNEVLSDVAVMKYIEEPFDLPKTKEFLEEAGLCEEPLVYALVWKETDRVIGHVIFHQYEETGYEIGWIIHKAYWGRGIASELTAALVEYAGTLGMESCVIECDCEQTASGHIAKKCGFQYEGIDDGCDVYRFILTH